MRIFSLIIDAFEKRFLDFWSDPLGPPDPFFLPANDTNRVNTLAKAQAERATFRTTVRTTSFRLKVSLGRILFILFLALYVVLMLWIFLRKPNSLLQIDYWVGALGLGIIWFLPIFIGWRILRRTSKAVMGMARFLRGTSNTRQFDRAVDWLDQHWAWSTPFEVTEVRGMVNPRWDVQGHFEGCSVLLLVRFNRVSIFVAPPGSATDHDAQPLGMSSPDVVQELERLSLRVTSTPVGFYARHDGPAWKFLEPDLMQRVLEFACNMISSDPSQQGRISERLTTLKEALASIKGDTAAWLEGYSKIWNIQVARYHDPFFAGGATEKETRIQAREERLMWRKVATGELGGMPLLVKFMIVMTLLVGPIMFTVACTTATWRDSGVKGLLIAFSVLCFLGLVVSLPFIVVWLRRKRARRAISMLADSVGATWGENTHLRTLDWFDAHWDWITPIELLEQVGFLYRNRRWHVYGTYRGNPLLVVRQYRQRSRGEGFRPPDIRRISIFIAKPKDASGPVSAESCANVLEELQRHGFAGRITPAGGYAVHAGIDLKVLDPARMKPVLDCVYCLATGKPLGA